MTLANRSLVTIDDLSNGEILSLFSLANEMSGAGAISLTATIVSISASLLRSLGLIR